MAAKRRKRETKKSDGIERNFLDRITGLAG